MSDDLDNLLADIDELEADEDKDAYPWRDAAVWSTDQRRMPDAIGDPFDDRFWRTATEDPDYDHYGNREPSGLCAGDPVVLSLTARDGSVVASWDMHTGVWEGNSEAVRMVQRASEDAGCDMDEFEKVGHGMMSLADDLDAAPNIAVYVSITPRPVPPAELLTAEHPDGREVRWDHGEWSGDRELCLDADELRRRHAEPDSLAAVAEALLIVCADGTMSPTVWAAAGVPF